MAKGLERELKLPGPRFPAWSELTKQTLGKQTSPRSLQMPSLGGFVHLKVL